MKRILLIGNSPLPEENAAVRPAAGLRTWQFLKGLERAGAKSHFKIKLVTIDMPECRRESCKANAGDEERTCGDARVCMEGGASAASAAENANEDASSGNDVEARSEACVEAGSPEHFIISKNDSELGRKLQKIHDEFQPDVIISVNTYPSSVAAKLKSMAPLWADLNGWIMAEAQAQAYKMDSNDYLGHYFEMERVVIEAADKFSGVSLAQCQALYGELAWAGRLVKESFAYKFVEHVPNGIEWLEHEKSQIGKMKEEREVEEIREERADTVTAGKGAHNGRTKSESETKLAAIPKHTFVLLWMGGYNTWVDEATLFKGVNEAMEKCPNLYFVSTGGGLNGLDNKTFEKFKKLIDGSPCKERFVFLGWVETAAIPSLYARANAGINVDRRCVETMMGARNRINEMMKFGLPVITTLGSEISYEVERAGAGLCVKSGDHAAFAEAIIRVHELWRGGGGRESKEFKNFGKCGTEYVQNYCNYAVTLEPLLKWLENPRAAPDRGVDALGFAGGLAGGLRGGSVAILRHGGLAAKRMTAKVRMFWRYLRENGFKKSFKKFLSSFRR